MPVVRLSIIIPAIGSQQQLEDTLVSVLSNRPGDCEVIVVYPGEYGDPYNLRDEVRFVEMSSQATRLGMANVGMDASRGEIMHLLAPGIEVVEGWTEAPLCRFAEDESVGLVSPLLVSTSNPPTVVSAGVQYRAGGGRRLSGAGSRIAKRAGHRIRVDGPTMNAAFYRKSALFKTGGFDALVGETLADIDLALSLRADNYVCVFEPACRLATKSDVPADEPGGFLQGRYAERLFWRHAMKIGWLRSLLLHPVEIVFDCLVSLSYPGAITRLAGRAVSLGELAIGRPDRDSNRKDTRSRQHGTPRLHEPPQDSKRLRRAG